MLISRITPQLRTRDLDGSIRFYTEKVGLALAFRHADFYAGIRAGDQVFHLKLADAADPSIAFVEAGDHLHLYLGTDDVDAVARVLKNNGVAFLKGPEDTPWKTRAGVPGRPGAYHLCGARQKQVRRLTLVGAGRTWVLCEGY